MFQRLAHLEALAGPSLLLPNRGRLYDFAQEIMRDMRILERRHWRKLHYRVDDPAGQVMLLRSADVPHLLECLPYAIGMTGLDYVLEAGGDLEIVEELDILQGRLALQVHWRSSVESMSDLPMSARIVTQYPEITRRAIEKACRSDIDVICINGAAEAFVSVGMADASVDVVCTGITAEVNGIKSVASIAETSAVLVRLNTGEPLSSFQTDVVWHARVAAARFTGQQLPPPELRNHPPIRSAPVVS